MTPIRINVGLVLAKIRAPTQSPTRVEELEANRLRSSSCLTGSAGSGLVEGAFICLQQQARSTLKRWAQAQTRTRARGVDVSTQSRLVRWRVGTPDSNQEYPKTEQARERRFAEGSNRHRTVKRAEEGRRAAITPEKVSRPRGSRLFGVPKFGWTRAPFI